MKMPNRTDPAQTTSGQRLKVAQIAAYLVALAVVIPLEVRRFVEETNGGEDPVAWLAGINIDTTLYFFLLLVAPLFWIVRRPLLGRRVRVSRTSTGPNHTTNENSSLSRMFDRRIVAVLAALVGCTSLVVSIWISSCETGGRAKEQFGNLPPAYHDEYSYLFQAKTFLAGKLSFPSHPTMPRLFDQMHVLNEGRFVSRYFPGNGFWMAPFLKVGHPYWGHWLAAAISSMFVFAIGRELSGNRVGVLAGLLTAVSPGMAIFSNLLLAHMPTLAGLTFFVWMFLRMQRTQSRLDGLLAGCGLTFAMFCRPMTAAGIGLPFGLWFFWKLIVGGRADGASPVANRWKLALSLGAPILLGLVMLLVYNRAITGDWQTTPYQLYTDTYTPRHVYGFNNVVRGEEHLGPKVLENYDRWAENLTPALAARNIGHRMLASWQWTLGIVPLVLAAVIFFVAGPNEDRRWWFLPAAIVSLHAVHIPYWFDGIMHWHYVFETGPLWLLMFAGVSGMLFQQWREVSRPWMPIWWTAVISASLLVAYTSVDLLWPQSRVEAGIDQIAFSRLKYQSFLETVSRLVTDRPALVLIEPDPEDRHIDYVVNDPSLDAEVLYGRYRPDEMKLTEIARQFPDRRLYLYNVGDRRLLKFQATGQTRE